MTLKTSDSGGPKGDHVTAYNLSFGDGTPSKKGKSLPRSVSHTYKHAGAFNATLSVTDAHHRTVKAKLHIVVPARATPVTTPVTPRPTPAPAPGPTTTPTTAAPTTPAPTTPAPTSAAPTTSDVPGWPSDASLRALDLSVDGATLSWTPAQGTPTGYVVRDASNAVVGQTSASDRTSNDLTLTGLATGSSQTWTVSADYAGGAEFTGPTTSATLLTATAAIDVTPILDTAHAVSREVFPSGDELSTTGADGTVYTLDIPQDALVGPETIDLIPITSISDSPLGFRAGVELEPSGLRFVKPALLRIHPPTALSDAQVQDEAPAMFDGTGADLTLVPELVSGAVDSDGQPDPSADARDDVIPILHFTGVEVGSGGASTQASVGAAAQTAAAQTSAAFQALFSAERAAALTGQPGDPDVVAKETAIYEQEWTNGVKPLLDAALSDSSLSDDAVSTSLGWLRTGTLLGILDENDPRIALIYADIVAILNHLFDQAKARCLQGADVRAVRDMLAAERELQLFGGGHSFDELDLGACANQKLTLTLSGSGQITAKGNGFSNQDWDGNLHSSDLGVNATGTTGAFDFDCTCYELRDGTDSVLSASMTGAPDAGFCSPPQYVRQVDGGSVFFAEVQPEMNPSPALANDVYVSSLAVNDQIYVDESLHNNDCAERVITFNRLFGATIRQGDNVALGSTTTLRKPINVPYTNFTVTSSITLRVDQHLG